MAVFIVIPPLPECAEKQRELRITIFKFNCPREEQAGLLWRVVQTGGTLPRALGMCIRRVYNGFVKEDCLPQVSPLNLLATATAE